MFLKLSAGSSRISMYLSSLCKKGDLLIKKYIIIIIFSSSEPSTERDIMTKKGKNTFKKMDCVNNKSDKIMTN